MVYVWGWRDKIVKDHFGVNVFKFTIQHYVTGDIYEYSYAQYEGYHRIVHFKESDTYASHQAIMLGWYGNAVCRTREINPIIDGYAIADWAWAAGTKNDVRIQWKGINMGFEITGASRGEQGNDMVRSTQFIMSWLIRTGRT